MTQRLKLTCNDLLFVNAYLANGRNGTKAYHTVHPKSSWKCANVEAVRVLAKPSVQEEIAKRVQYEAGITRAGIESSLLRYQQWAEAKGDYVAGASICMDAAKLAGFLVEKRQDITISQTDLSSEELWAELQRRTLSEPITADNIDSDKSMPESEKSHQDSPHTSQDAPQ